MKRDAKLTISMIVIVVLMLGIGSSLLGGCTTKEPKVFTLKVQTFLPPNDMTHICEVEPKFDAIEEALEGRVVLERYQAGSLVSYGEELDAVGSGVVDIMPTGLSSFTGATPDNIGELELFPMLYESVEDAYNIYYDAGLLDLFREVFQESFDTYYLAPSGSGPFGFITSFPVQSINDFKGKKIESGAAGGALLEAMGGIPTSVPMPEFYMSLSLGTIDGLYWTFPELESAKFKEVAPYAVQPPMVQVSLFSWLMNMDKWNSLPDDIQETLEQVLKDTFIPCFEDELRAVDVIFMDPDITLCELPDEDVAFLKQVASKALDERVGSKGPIGAKAVEIIKNYYAGK
jgi:TRAP-type C4-dicarboxylate transport system substrate-binding protein